MSNRRELYTKKLQLYYSEMKENSEHTAPEEENIDRKLWTQQLEVTQHFTRDFVAEVRTERRGIVGKLVIFIKRIFRKGTYYIFKQFTERVYDFQSRSMELAGEFIKLLVKFEGQQRHMDEQLLCLEEGQHHIEDEQRRIEEEQRNLEEGQRQLEEEQRRLEEEQQHLRETESAMIADVRRQINELTKAQMSEFTYALTELNKKLDKHFDPLNMLQSAYLTQLAGGIYDKQISSLFAYRYLLGREPENAQIVRDNEKSWRDLRTEITESAEYKTRLSKVFENGRLEVEGITYFFPPNDIVISLNMLEKGINWAKYDIENFIALADRVFYRGESPQAGIFLDIGGNIGTTSLYCKLKLKHNFHFIAFEPVSLFAKLLAANAAFNGVGSDVTVEQIALSNNTYDDAVMRINRENWGNSSLTDDGAESDMEETEIVSATTLDRYIAENGVKESDIKYIWLDVEGHEYEVLKGASALLKKQRIPLCMQFNQSIYRKRGNYEEMLALLKDNFDSFVVSEHIDDGDIFLRPIQELYQVWSEEKGRTCDLILL